MTRTFVIAIDPGISGGVCVLTRPSPNYGDGVVELFPTPTRKDAAGNTVVDGRELARRLAKARDECALLDPGARYVPVIERVWAHSGEGVKSVFTFGKATGAAIGVLEALFGPVDEALPRDWQTGVLGSPSAKRAESKPRVLAWARATYPEQSLLATPRSRVPHPGLVDALAIARYGLDTLAP